jgi:hypothetical protein
MSKPKKLIIIVWLFLLVLACLYVPQKRIGFFGGFSNEYDFIFNSSNNVDIARLIFELIGITALCGVVFMLCDLFQKE